MCIKWSDLFSKGSLVDVDIHQYKFQKRIQPETIGIHDDGHFKDAVDPGHTKLLPKKYIEPLNSVVYQIKKCVEYYSLPFLKVPGSRYIPNVSIPKLVDELTVLKREYLAAVENLISNYDMAKTEQLPEIKKALEKYAEGKEDAEGIVERAMVMIQDIYPSGEYIRSRFDVTWKARAITAPINADVADLFESEATEVKDVVGSMVKDLRKELQDKLDSVIVSANKNQRVQPKTLDSLENLCDRLDEMNILGDKTLKDAVSLVRIIINQDSNDITGITNQMVKIKEELDETAEEAQQKAIESLTSGKRKLDL